MCPRHSWVALSYDSDSVANVRYAERKRTLFFTDRSPTPLLHDHRQRYAGRDTHQIGVHPLNGLAFEDRAAKGTDH